jgi:hypothetical protein
LAGELLVVKQRGLRDFMMKFRFLFLLLLVGSVAPASQGFREEEQRVIITDKMIEEVEEITVNDFWKKLLGTGTMPGEKNCPEPISKEEAKKHFDAAKKLGKQTYKDKKALGKEFKDFLGSFDPKLLEKLRDGDEGALNKFMEELKSKNGIYLKNFLRDQSKKKKKKILKNWMRSKTNSSYMIIFPTSRGIYVDGETGLFRYNMLSLKKESCSCGFFNLRKLDVTVCKMNEKTGIVSCLDVDLLPNTRDLLRGLKEPECRSGNYDDPSCSIDRQVEETKKEYEALTQDQFEKQAPCGISPDGVEDGDDGETDDSINRKYENLLETLESYNPFTKRGAFFKAQ